MNAVHRTLGYLQWPLIVGLGLLGLWEPWNQGAVSQPSSLVWIASATVLSKLFVLNLSIATYMVTIAAVVLCFLGASLRIWSQMEPESNTARLSRAAGRVGTILVALAISILMPPAGAALFLLGVLLIPPLFDLAGLRPDLKVKRSAPSVAATGASSLLLALGRESFSVTLAFCLASLAWRFSAELLIRALFICFGASLVIRALLPAKEGENSMSKRKVGAD
jgi:putative Mn2+ efflux pump MntP